MDLLKRKIDKFLIEWKNRDNKKPLIIKGTGQIGKTTSIKNFAKNNYKNIVEINFAVDKKYKSIFDDGFNVDTIIRNISFMNPDFKFIPEETLIFFDETENGNFIFNNKKYGVLLEMDGDVIEEERKNTNCLECKNNIFERRRFYQEFIKNKELNNENLNNQET